MTDIINTFRQLHTNSTPLRLPNAWDAGSARLFESQGASAIATTSAGVAWALGYQDARVLPIDELVGAVSRIARVLKVPLSIDIENGYSDDPKVVADNVMRLVDLGIAGINIEDGSDSAALLTAKIEAARNAVSKAGADLFVNARSDVFLAKLVDDSQLVEESIRRGKQYAQAGADGLFLPGIVDGEDITAVVAGSSLPLNAMAWPGLANAVDLGALGVRRLSAGAAIAQSLWKRAEALSLEFLKSGRSDFVYTDCMSYSDLQNLFAGK